MNFKTPHQLKPGDIVRAHGGRFLVMDLPRESQCHFPEGYWPQMKIGPSAVAAVCAVCIEGEVKGYFKPGSSWSFQGNFNYGARVHVEEPDSATRYCVNDFGNIEHWEAFAQGEQFGLKQMIYVGA